MKFLKLFLLLFVIQTQAQQGGMWIPSLLKGMNETEMKNLGMKMSIKDILSHYQISSYRLRPWYFFSFYDGDKWKIKLHLSAV